MSRRNAHILRSACVGIAKGDDVLRFKDDDKVLAITMQRHTSLWFVQQSINVDPVGVI
jgi:hypothetical protein